MLIILHLGHMQFTSLKQVNTSK